MWRHRSSLYISLDWLPNTAWFLQNMPRNLVSILFFFQNNEFLKMFLTISSCGMGNGYEAVIKRALLDSSP